MPKKLHGVDLLHANAEKALKKAIQGVIQDHKRTGRPLVLWRNGKVALVSAARLPRKST